MVCLSGGEFFIYFFEKERERALFSNRYMRTLAPGRRQKAAKVRPDLRMKDALLIKLCRAAAVEGTEGGEGKRGLVVVVVGAGGRGGRRLSCNTDARTQSDGEPCVHRSALCALRTTRQESLWRPVGGMAEGLGVAGVGWRDGGRFGGGKYLPPGIITGPLLAAARPLGEPD